MYICVNIINKLIYEYENIIREYMFNKNFLFKNLRITKSKKNLGITEFMMFFMIKTHTNRCAHDVYLCIQVC